MAAREIFCVVHPEVLDAEGARELGMAAKRIDPAAETTALVFGAGAAAEAMSGAVAGDFARVWQVGHDALAYPNAELMRVLCTRLLPAGTVVLLPHNTFGMDLGPGLAVKTGGSYLPDCVGLEGLHGQKLTAVRQEFGGQVNVRVTVDLSSGGVLTLRPGAFASGTGAAAGAAGTGSGAAGASSGAGDASAGQTGGAAIRQASGGVEDKTAEALAGGLPDVRRRTIEVLEAESGDVDITKSSILISCGRGIESEDNLEIIEELAEALGGDVSCSRPVVDARWLDRSRQVGTSGRTVKPKVYLALGISGAFQHLAGIRGNPFMVAINKNPRAPIFQVADVGIVGDLLEIVPELTEAVQEMKR